MNVVLSPLCGGIPPVQIESSCGRVLLQQGESMGKEGVNISHFSAVTKAACFLPVPKVGKF